MKTDHSLIVFEKLAKAYAKNDQMDLVKDRINSWIKAGYIDEKMAGQLFHASKILHQHRTQFSIADDMEKAKDNFIVAMRGVDAGYDVFLLIFEMLYGIHVDDGFGVSETNRFYGGRYFEYQARKTRRL